MTRQTFTQNQFQDRLRSQDYWLETTYILGLLAAALVLYSINLGSLPLRDWDEGTVAQVAKEIWLGSKDSLNWLFPTLWGEPYLNKPPLVHLFVACFYWLGGVNEWTARLPSAILTACSVPLLYGVGREIFSARTPALFSALIYLTLLPVARHGRLAMLDGAVLCFGILTFLCVLRARRDLRWSLGAGIGLAAIALTKGIMGLLLGSIALLFLFWDTPRLITSFYMWVGVLVGIMPAIAWYFAQYLHAPQNFVNTSILSQSLERIYTSVDGHQGPPWYYLLEILKYSWPWLLFSLWGIKLAVENRNWSWAKFTLVWSGVYLGAVSIMTTKLPWYILPVYPALALAGGAQLAAIYNLPSYRFYPRSWTLILGLIAKVAIVGCIYYFFFTENKDNFFIAVILAAVALTMSVAAYLVSQKDRQFISILFWGMYVCLLLFFLSPHWIWELNESYPVKPVAQIIHDKVSSDRLVYTSFDYERPSLNFYSDRRVIPIQVEKIEKLSSQELQLLKQQLIELIPKNKENLQEKLKKLKPQNLEALKLAIPETEIQLRQKLQRKIIHLQKIHSLKQYWLGEDRPYLLIERSTLRELNLESAQILGDAAPANWVLITKNKQ